MPGKSHRYDVVVTWTGNQGQGTTSYKSYSRSHDIKAQNKPTISGSADPAFQGDANCWNPEDLLVASLSACHKLWYLHLCAVAGITVRAYEDSASGTMTEDSKGGGAFTEVTLRPSVTVSPESDVDMARTLHHQAHEKCFIANSVNFPVRCLPEILIEQP